MWLARSLCVALLLMVVVLTPRQTPAAQPGLSLQRLRPAALQPPSGREPRLLSAAPPSSAHTAAVTMTSYLPLLVFPPVWPITRVSVSSDGAEGNGESQSPSLSADGRFVAFGSYASNLVFNDTNGTGDIFVHDRRTGQTTRVSVSSDGAEGNGESQSPSLSADGRFVAFGSYASNLVFNDTNGTGDIFVHDRQTRQTTRVSVASERTQANGASFHPAISADGRLVAFASEASNLFARDDNVCHGGNYLYNCPDIFVHDRQTGQTTLVSVASDGTPASSASSDPAISADGRFVAFESYATNLVAGDTSGNPDSSSQPLKFPGWPWTTRSTSKEKWPMLATIFVRDRQTGQTTRASVAFDGTPANDPAYNPAISAAGRFVAFESSASNLVPGDTNGTDDVFVYDRQTGQTTRVSVAADGAQSNDFSWSSSLSADGRFVAFMSRASNLVPNDTQLCYNPYVEPHNCPDIFVHDRQTGQTTRVSVASDGAESNELSARPNFSADGRFVAFVSGASNLIEGDTNNGRDVFLVALPTAP